MSTYDSALIGLGGYPELMDNVNNVHQEDWCLHVVDRVCRIRALYLYNSNS